MNFIFNRNKSIFNRTLIVDGLGLICSATSSARHGCFLSKSPPSFAFGVTDLIPWHLNACVVAGKGDPFRTTIGTPS